MPDNAITWLEPTTKCNLYCEGCYRENDPAGHKPLQTVIAELETVKRLRNSDGISIAGGEPLIYPDIVELVRYISSQGWKPILNSNGQALTPELVTKLRDAGLVSFTFHVDSHQNRPGWQGKTEEELNELRLRLARTCAEYGKGRIACSFNATIYRDTLDEIPMLVHWAQKHIDVVNTMVFILFRSAKAKSGYDGFVHGQQDRRGQSRVSPGPPGRPPGDRGPGSDRPHPSGLPGVRAPVPTSTAPRIRPRSNGSPACGWATPSACSAAGTPR